ncbi:alanine racemase [Streptomyces luteireticuli]|uniref:Alanine racemase n=1 Tax=Streptomyces luteireticuli TaxID=173858 RepID=A0ABN0YK70_9ACTN
MSHTDPRIPDLGAPGLPELRLDLSALENNIRLMARWSHEHGVELSPHIKTTMTRPIVDLQMAAGAWGVTVATTRQAGIALGWGIRRILIANQVIHGTDLARIRKWLRETPDLELYCFIDSMAGLARAQVAMGQARNPLRLLIDVGAGQGRTGVRKPSEARVLAEAAAQGPAGAVLAGVAGYEGIRPNNREAATTEAVDAHCRTTVGIFHDLVPFFRTERPLLSMGGSAFPDRAVAAIDELRRRHPDIALLPVVRSGCYVTHDHGTYEQVSPVPGLRPALTVRAVVLSTPEPGHAVVGAGRRELPYDAGLPVLVGVRGPYGMRLEASQAVAARIYDHHLVLTGVQALQVGDVVDLGISHPCSAFDRWPSLVVVDDEECPLEVWHPQFH